MFRLIFRNSETFEMDTLTFFTEQDALVKGQELLDTGAALSYDVVETYPFSDIFVSTNGAGRIFNNPLKLLIYMEMLGFGPQERDDVLYEMVDTIADYVLNLGYSVDIIEFVYKVMYEIYESEEKRITVSDVLNKTQAWLAFAYLTSEWQLYKRTV